MQLLPILQLDGPNPNRDPNPNCRTRPNPNSESASEAKSLFVHLLACHTEDVPEDNPDVLRFVSLSHEERVRALHDPNPNPNWRNELGSSMK